MIKVSDYIIKFVVSLGVKNIFLLPGGGCMHLVDSVGKNKALSFINCLHDQSVAIAADAYSQYTQNIGVGLVTTGPGGTNAITGVTASWIDSIPVLIFSGQVKRADLIGDRGVRQMGPQEVDIVSMVKPVTKYAVTVMEPEKIRYHLEKSVNKCRSGRPGPVWIDVPLDVQGAIIDEDSLLPYTPSNLTCGAGLAKKGHHKLDTLKILQLIKKAQRPVILAGNGVRLSGALSHFKKLISMLQIPVLTTWKSIDFMGEDDPLFFGRPGAVGQRGANFIQQNSDLIISIGARLDCGQVAFSYQNFARGAVKVIVDVDSKEIDKLDFHVDHPVCCDAGQFIDSLLNEIEDDFLEAKKDWLSTCKNWAKKYPVILKEYWQDKKVNTYCLIDILSDQLSKDDVIVPGSSGACSEITLQSFRVKQGQRIFNSPGLGSMGFGMVAAIGACVASGDKRTICLIGDGGLQHNIQEMELLRRYNLPLKLFVLNNEGYGSIKATQNNHFNGNLVGCNESSGLSLPATSKIADAYGIDFIKIESNDELKEKVDKVLDSHGPFVCEVMIDPDSYTAPRVSSMVKPDGSIVSKPMEDLWPFLAREEFFENMIVEPLKE